jgi:hypothetical protein
MLIKPKMVPKEGPGDRAAGDQDQHEHAKLGADDAERHAAKPPQTIGQHTEKQSSEGIHEPRCYTMV